MYQFFANSTRIFIFVFFSTFSNELIVFFVCLFQLDNNRVLTRTGRQMTIIVNEKCGIKGTTLSLGTNQIWWNFIGREDTLLYRVNWGWDMGIACFSMEIYYSFVCRMYISIKYIYRVKGVCFGIYQIKQEEEKINKSNQYLTYLSISISIEDSCFFSSYTYRHKTRRIQDEEWRSRSGFPLRIKRLL